jgi:hypothetical protein
VKVLIACEYSGIVREAFTAKGHDAWSCDLLPTEIPGKHHLGDIFEIINDGWDLMVAHPPCTYLSNSGVSWLHKDKSRWQKMEDGALFFKRLLEVDIQKKAIENPIMHKYAKDIIGRKQTQIVQPWMFGHAESKATCLWLEGLPPLKETHNVKEEMLKLPDSQRQRLHYLPPSPDRWKERSRTFKGIADAMAESWG